MILMLSCMFSSYFRMLSNNINPYHHLKKGVPNGSVAGYQFPLGFKWHPFGRDLVPRKMEALTLLFHARKRKIWQLIQWYLSIRVMLTLQYAAKTNHIQMRWEMAKLQLSGWWLTLLCSFRLSCHILKLPTFRFEGFSDVDSGIFRQTEHLWTTDEAKLLTCSDSGQQKLVILCLKHTKRNPSFGYKREIFVGINPGACVNCGDLHSMCLALVCLSWPTTEAPIYGPIDSQIPREKMF